jgi:hypothetical protein
MDEVVPKGEAEIVFGNCKVSIVQMSYLKQPVSLEHFP